MSRKLLAFCLTFLLAISAFAQNGSVHVDGVVVDEAGLPVIGAAVMVKSTDKGTVTDENGNFSFDNLSPQAELQASALGYATATCRIGGAS